MKPPSRQGNNVRAGKTRDPKNSLRKENTGRGGEVARSETGKKKLRGGGGQR